MVPFEAFSIEAPHSSIAFCSGCVGGTQCESLSSNVLSWASAADAARGNAKADAMTIATGRLARDDDMISSSDALAAAALAVIEPQLTGTVKSPTRETLDHIARHGHRFHSSTRWMSLHPHPRLEALHRERCVLGEAVTHLEARAADLRHRGLDRDVVAKPGRNEEAAMRIDQRMPGEIIGFEIIALDHAERALDERRGAGVEECEIARVEDNAAGIAIAPFDAHRTRVDEHSRFSRLV